MVKLCLWAVNVSLDPSEPELLISLLSFFLLTHFFPSVSVHCMQLYEHYTPVGSIISSGERGDDKKLTTEKKGEANGFNPDCQL